MSDGSPRVVLAMPSANGALHLPQAIESLLLQTFRDFALLVVDDDSTDNTVELARTYAAIDSRLSVFASTPRLGLVGNWRRARDHAGAVGSAEYFSWVSDHDVWHPEWLESLVGALDKSPRAVLAHAYALRISEHGWDFGATPCPFVTAGIGDPLARLRHVISSEMRAGDVIYGLFRNSTLAKLGPFPAVINPDRLFLGQLALRGEFHQVPRFLWHRRYRTGVEPSHARQRGAFYPDRRPPLHAYLPWPLAHTFLLRRALRSRPVEGLDPDEVQRVYLREAATVYIQHRRRRRRIKRRERRDARRARFRTFTRIGRKLLPHRLVRFLRPVTRLWRMVIVR